MHRHLFPLNYLLPELHVQEFDLVDVLKVAESQKVFHFTPISTKDAKSLGGKCSVE